MRNIHIKNEMSAINFHRKAFITLSKQASDFINKLNETFKEQEIDIKASSVSNNCFDFSFWGLNFIVKSEILFDVERKGFCTGELNTYIRNIEDETQILSYPFDSIGNIGNGAVLEDFSYYYYTNFIKLIIDYSNNNKIKFKL